MTSPYNLFATNQDLEAGKGVILDYPGFSISIHRAGGANKKYAQALVNKMRPHRHKVQNGTMDEEVAQKLLIEVFAETVVTGWENVKGKDGKEIPYTKENCVKLLTDLPELFKDIQDQATSIAIFKSEIEETDIKN